MPRVHKDKLLQKSRTKDKAEIFTPLWICNAQVNLIDNAWFGRKNVFNHELTEEKDSLRWKTNHNKVEFPEGKTWKDYIKSTQLEITFFIIYKGCMYKLFFCFFSYSVTRFHKNSGKQKGHLLPC